MEKGNASYRRLLAALDSGDVDDLREAVRGLDAGGEEILAKRVGGAHAENVRRKVRRSRAATRRVRLGRVVVIHGIMGAQLDVADDVAGENDRIWVNLWSIFRGRIAELALNASGGPADPKVRVRVAGQLPDYVPLVLELDERWDVKPFAFDWRADIDKAAQSLADTIRQWAGREPCHIIAHSMGGLVARRMIARFPDVWAQMEDEDGLKRGGRLVFLGTPNRGSFAIPMVLTGTEPIVRKLAAVDGSHDVEELMPILASFPGSYQMLPAFGSASDDRDRLFDPATWGDAPVSASHLALGRAFQDSISSAVDPARMVYVAGYDQETPYRIRVKAPGEFQYLVTRNGDGRVPHDLGLLEGVPTLWVEEAHGDLPKNKAVLAGVHDLLLTGETSELERSRPVARALAGRAGEKWIDEIPDAAVAELADMTRPRRGAKAAASIEQLSDEEQARAEALIVRGFAGDEVGDAPASGAGGRKPRSKKAAAEPVPLNIEVICGDVCKVAGDIYAVGHYVGVLPLGAEAALDAVVSPPGAEARDRVIHTHTRRGVLCAELGEIALYPWADKSGRLVALAGMGHLGTFGPSELRHLGYSLTLAVSALPNVRTVCSVLIGSGEGGVDVRDAVEALMLGVSDAVRRDGPKGDIDTIKLVERDLRKADAIHAAMKRLEADKSFRRVLALKVARSVEMSRTAEPSQETSLSLALAAFASAANAKPSSALRRAADRVLGSVPGNERLRAGARKGVEALARDAAGSGGTELARRLEIHVHDAEPRTNEEERQQREDHAAGKPASRFSCVREGDELNVAALTDTAVVPQRPLRFDLALFDELARKASDPDFARAGSLGELIGRLLIPHDFAPFLDRSAALVAELDRYTARLPWELMSLGLRHDGVRRALSLKAPFARQLRTAYSGAPTVAPPEDRELRALVVGDPGDPDKGHSLPGARREAIEVKKILRRRGVLVTARIGAPSVPRLGELARIKSAGRLEVLELLLSGRFHIVHYCGHGDFDPDHSDRAGWVFADGLLTAREIERIEHAPRLVVANACLSGLTSDRLSSGRTATESRDEAGLLPTLADEFFKRGVRDYIGTAWEVSDAGAIRFARKFYSLLLGEPEGSTIGDALVAARNVLHQRRRVYGALWAAYQHYGDPRQQIRRAPSPKG